MDALRVDGEAFPQGSVLWQAHQFGIEFFKHLRVNALAALWVAVFLYLVDKEQGQNLISFLCSTIPCLNAPQSSGVFVIRFSSMSPMAYPNRTTSILDNSI